MKKQRYIESNAEWFVLFFGMLKAQTGNLFNAGNNISPKLSEMISLSVSRVNGCANCSFLHSRMALEKGLDNMDIQNLLSGVHEGIGKNELTAMLYAEHWAETMGNVSQNARLQALEYYGDALFKSIEASVKTVFFGNICSNTVEEKLRGNKNIRLIPYLLSLPVSEIIRLAGKYKDKK